MKYEFTVNHILQSPQSREATLIFETDGFTKTCKTTPYSFSPPTSLVTDIVWDSDLLTHINLSRNVGRADLVVGSSGFPELKLSSGQPIRVSRSLYEKCSVEGNNLVLNNSMYSIQLPNAHVDEIYPHSPVTLHARTKLETRKSFAEKLLIDYDSNTAQMSCLSRERSQSGQLFASMIYASGMLGKIEQFATTSDLGTMLAHMHDTICARATFEPWGAASVGGSCIRLSPFDERYVFGVSSRRSKVNPDSISFTPGDGNSGDSLLRLDFGILTFLLSPQAQHNAWSTYFGSEYVLKD